MKSTFCFSLFGSRHAVIDLFFGVQPPTDCESRFQEADIDAASCYTGPERRTEGRCSVLSSHVGHHTVALDGFN